MILLFSYTYLIDVRVVGVRFFKPSFVKKVFGYRRPFFGIGDYARYSPGLIRHRAVRLEEIYRDSGFFDVKVRVRDSVVGRNRIVIVEVEEGPRYVIRKLIAPGEFLRGLKVELPRPYSESFVSSVEMALIEWYQNRGFPFVEVQRDLYVEDTLVDVVYVVDSGPKVGIRDIVFRSADSTRLATRMRILYREVTLKRGECFSIKKLQESLSRLYRTLLFTSIRWKLEGIRPAPKGVCGDSSAVLVFYVREGKPRVLDITAGIQNETERPVLLSSEMSFQHLNLFNNLQRVQVSVSSLVDLMEQSMARFSYNVLYQEPYFLDLYLRANLRIRGEYDVDRRMKYVGVYGEIIKPYILNRVELSVGPSVEMRYPIGDAGNSYRLFKTFERAYFDTRDNIFDPSWSLTCTWRRRVWDTSATLIF